MKNVSEARGQREMWRDAGATICRGCEELRGTFKLKTGSYIRTPLIVVHAT